MTAPADELWNMIASAREGILATVSRDGSPQLSNVLYVADAEARTVHISTTADRLKARNLLRDPHAALHVSGQDFWHYAVARCQASVGAVASTPGDDATDALFAIHSAFYGDLDRSAFDREMIEHRRLSITLRVQGIYGVQSTTGRRPVDSER